MKFEHPLFFHFLWFLLIPIAIHLFSFRKHKVFYFSSIQFLKSIEQESKSTKKLKHILVLIARLLAFIALITAFAQPYIPLQKSTDISSKTVLCIYIDNSFSMEQMGTEGQLLSMAKDEAKKIIEKAGNATKILLFSNNLDRIEEKIQTKATVLQRIDKITTSSFSPSMEVLLAWLNDRIIEKYPSEKVTKQLILLSDFQKNMLSQLQITNDPSLYIYPVHLQPENKTNISIDSIWFTSPHFKAKINNEINIKLTNQGNQDEKNIELTLDINSSKRTIFASAAAHQSTLVKLNYSDTKPGEKIGKVHINDRGLNFDDDFYFTYNVKPHAEIAIIQGENAHKNILEVFNLDSYYKCFEIPYTGFLSSSITNKRLVILNGCNEIHDGMLEALKNFSQKGGTIVVFPGTKISIPDYTKLAQTIAIPRLNQLKKQNVSCAQLAYSQPFYQTIFDKKPTKLQLPIVKKYYTTEENGYEKLITLLNDDDFFIKHKQSYLFTSSLDSTFSDFTNNSLFPVSLLRMGELSLQKNDLYLTINKNARFQFFPTTVNEGTYKVSNNDFDFVPLIEENEASTQLILHGNDILKNCKQGIYALENKEFKTAIALNYLRKESVISTLSESEVENLFPNSLKSKIHSSTLNQHSPTITFDLDKPIEYWRFFLILALVFYLTEMALVKFMNQK
jgi:hypothetical protein